MEIIQKIFPEETKLREIELHKNQPILNNEDKIKENIIKDNWREIINKHKPQPQNIEFVGQLNNEFIEQLQNLI
jgi:hypothetical protein